MRLKPGRIIVLIITSLTAIGLMIALLPSPTTAAIQISPQAHKSIEALALTHKTEISTTQTPTINPDVQNLELVGHLTATAKAFFVQQDYAYLAAGEEGLKIVDISDRTAPMQVGTYTVTGSIEEVAVTDTVAVALDDVGNVLLLDVSTPAAPVEVGYSPIPGAPADLAVANDHIWVATKGRGLFPFQLTPVGETSPSTNILQPVPHETPTSREN